MDIFDKRRMKMALFHILSLAFFSLHDSPLCSAANFSLKIECLIPLDVTVKGHWERLTFARYTASHLNILLFTAKRTM